MKGQIVAYIRVSSVDQNTERQLADLEPDKTFLEKVSAKDRNRPQLQECLAYLRKGDELHVHSIDRLARNLRDLEDIIGEILRREAMIRFHKEGLIFSGTDSPFQVLQLQIIGAVAQFERALIGERQREGIQAAKLAGRHLGRRSSLTADQVAEIRKRKSEPKGVLAKEFQVCRQTIYKALSQT